MKKLISLSLLCVSGLVASAASFTFTLPTATMTNWNNIQASVAGYNGGPIRVLTATLASPANAAGSCKIIDCPTNDLTASVGAYTNFLLSATNYITTWTNYYGYTNSVTNFALVKLSNYVAAATLTYPVKLALSALTNTTAYVDQINTFFSQGVGITNTSLGTINVTVTYQQ